MFTRRAAFQWLLIAIQKQQLPDDWRELGDITLRQLASACVEDPQRAKRFESGLGQLSTAGWSDPLASAETASAASPTEQPSPREETIECDVSASHRR